MGTKKNLLEELRKKNGCELSQEQIAIRMGLPAEGEKNNNASSRYSNIISKFETGETKDWYVTKFFGYCDVTGQDPREVFSTRYPDHAYSRKFLEKQEKELNMMSNMNRATATDNRKTMKITATDEVSEEIMERFTRHPLRHIEIVEPQATGYEKTSTDIQSIKANTCVIGSHYTARSTIVTIPEIAAAIKEGKNIFIITNNPHIKGEIHSLTTNTDYEVYNSEFPYNEIDWFSTIFEPESVTMLTDTLLSQWHRDQDTTKIKDLFVSILKAYLWSYDNYHDNDKRSLSCVNRYMMSLSCERIAALVNNRYTAEEISELRSELDIALATLVMSENTSATKLSEIFRKKHIILYTYTSSPKANNVPFIALEQYMRIVTNVKEYSAVSGSFGKDKRQYEIIIDDFANGCPLPYKAFKSWLTYSDQIDTRFMFSTTSIEIVKDSYPDEWEDLLANFPRLLLTFRRDTLVSVCTEEYFIKRASKILITGFIDKKETENTNNVDTAASEEIPENSLYILTSENGRIPFISPFYQNTEANI